MHLPYLIQSIYLAQAHCACQSSFSGSKLALSYERILLCVTVMKVCVCVFGSESVWLRRANVTEQSICQSSNKRASISETLPSWKTNSNYFGSYCCDTQHPKKYLTTTLTSNNCYETKKKQNMRLMEHLTAKKKVKHGIYIKCIRKMTRILVEIITTLHS